VTCFPGADKAAPAIAFDHSRRVIADGNLITSQGAGTALDFAMEIVGYLYGPEAEKALKDRIVY
jgi:4-methyl-5(b-hydroxyethyl)-thiazole monophosphate biosynthesis